MYIRFLLSLFLAAGIAFAPLSSSAARQDTRPNIVFVLIDDMGWADAACYGSSLNETPNIDRLAAQGMRFTQAYSAAPICSPTRASILTGRYPTRYRLTNFLKGVLSPPDSPVKTAAYADGLPPDELTLAQALKGAGYATAHIGKWHLGGKPEEMPERRGFDVNIGGSASGGPRSYFWPQWRDNPPLAGKADGDYLTDRLTDEACGFIEANKDRRFFVYLAHYAVHIPLGPKPDKLAKYEAKLRQHPPGPNDQSNPHYAAMMESVDEGIGKIMGTLRRLGIDRNTIVVFTSDNGGLSVKEGPLTPATTNHPLRAGKGYLYEGGIRVPWIVRWPDTVPAGITNETPVSSVDFFPTFCRAAGIDTKRLKTAGPIDGLDLLPILREPKSKLKRRPVFWHYPHFSNQGGRPSAAVRLGDHKLIEFYETGKRELYDLRTDPSETRDIALDFPNKVRELAGELKRWRDNIHANMPSENTARTGASPTPSTGDGRPHYYLPSRETKPQAVRVDACIYGGTASGAAAAIQLARLGRSVVLIANGHQLGGMTTGGLSYTDIGNKAAIGGIAREFYRRVGKKYGVAEEWNFEPKVASQVITEMVAEAKVPVHFGQFLRSVKRQGGRIVSLTTESGLTVDARIFFDATYEGDLMAKAAVKYTVGREANSVYGETINGIQVRDKHQFERAVDPFVVEGDPASGLLPGIDPAPLDPSGSGDKRIQAYTFRLCLTTNPGNRIPWEKPSGYDPKRYELLARYFATGWNEEFGKYDPLRGGKVDKNNHGAFSTDFIGANYAWPEGSYRTRERLFQEHLRYVQGYFWFMATDPRVPEPVRRRMNEYGPAKDEFSDTGGWPHQLYVREARRLVSDYVMTEHHCRGREIAPDPVGLGAYGMDSHNCQRFEDKGRVMNEGDVQVGGFRPYRISYRAIVPSNGQCQNLFVPICLSATHIAYGSIRMEPVFMILAQSAAFAADIAIQRNVAVQDVEYSELRERLSGAGQVLDWPAPPLRQQ